MAGDQEEIQKENYTVKLCRNVRTGVILIETWEKDGRSHREGGPALIVRDADTGMVIKEGWIRNNEYDRDGGPAIILRKPDTGRVYYSAWYRAGKKVTAPPRPRRGSRVTTSLRRRASPSRGPTA